jgi:hypothetical protein
MTDAPRAMRANHRRMRTLRLTYIGLAWIFLACVVVQFFLAGLGVFVGAAQFEVHRGFGYLFGWLTVIMLVVALAGRLGRRWVLLPAVLLVLFFMQSVFVLLRDDYPFFAALHPVNGLIIFAIAMHVATRSRVLAAPVAAQPAVAAEISRA